MAVNWGMLAAYPNAGEAFNNAFQQGQQQTRQNTVRAAMAALAADPNNQRALAALAQADPATAMQFQQQRIAMAKEQLAQHQDNILKGAEILRQFNPKDQQSYSAALATAQQAGIDLTGVPQEYNPQYVDGVIHLADALKPQPDDISTIAAQPNAPVIAYDKRNGTTKVLIAPNDGSHPVGAPTNAGPPQAAIAYLKAHPDLASHFDEKYGQGAAASILGNGGQAGSPSPVPFSR